MSRRSTHMLKVGIVSAKYLKQTNSWNSGSDAFVDVRVSCSPTEKKSTSVVKQATNPEWGETFDFVLSDNPADDVLLIQVNGQKSYSSAAFIGRVEIPITLLLHQMPVDGWYRLLPQYSFPGVSSKTPPRIRLRLHYYYIGPNGLPQQPQFVNGNNPGNTTPGTMIPGQFNRTAYPPTVMARAPGVVGTVTGNNVQGTMTRNQMMGGNPSAVQHMINSSSGNNNNNTGGKREYPCPICGKKYNENEINQHAERCMDTTGVSGRDVHNPNRHRSNTHSPNTGNHHHSNPNQNNNRNGGGGGGYSNSDDDEELTNSLQRLNTGNSNNPHNNSQNRGTATSLTNFVNNQNNNNNNNTNNNNNQSNPNRNGAGGGAYPSLAYDPNTTYRLPNNNNTMNSNMSASLPMSNTSNTSITNNNQNNNNGMSSNMSNSMGLNSMAARMELLNSMEQALPPMSLSNSNTTPQHPQQQQQQHQLINNHQQQQLINNQLINNHHQQQQQQQQTLPFSSTPPPIYNTNNTPSSPSSNTNSNHNAGIPSFPSIPNVSNSNNASNTTGSSLLSNNGNNSNSVSNSANGSGVPVVYPYYEPHLQHPNIGNSYSVSADSGANNSSMNSSSGIVSGSGAMDLPPQYNVAVGYNQSLYNNNNNGVSNNGGNNNNNNSSGYSTLDSLLDN